MLKPIFNFFKDKVASVLVIFSILTASVVGVAQICLRNASTRAIFTNIEKYENINYKSAYAEKVGYVTIKMKSGEPSDDVEIWLNGQKAQSFNKAEICLKVDCDSVIEIKNDSGKEISVVATTIKNGRFLLLNKLQFSKGIKILCSVSLDD